MKNILTLLLIALGTLVMAEETPEWTFTYKADKLPDKSGIAQYGAKTYGKLQQDKLCMSSLNSDKAFYYMLSSSKVGLNSETGYTIEFKAKIINTDQAANTSAIHIDAEDGRKEVKAFWGLNFYRGKDSNYVVFHGSKAASPIAIGNDFHTYRITVKDKSVTLYIDNIKAADSNVSDKVSTDRLRFGDLTEAADGEWCLEYLKICNKGAIAPVK